MEYIITGILLVILIAIFSQFRPAVTQKVSDNLYAVRCVMVNFYVYQIGDQILLFDTGISAGMAKRGLSKLGLSPDAVTHIFLTHTDSDHAGGMSAFPNAKRYISKAEKQMVDGSTARRGFIYNTRFTPEYLLEDGESVTIDENTHVEIRVTPGHTTGSSIFLLNEKYLITGDLLRITNEGKVKPFLWLMNKDHKQDVKSVGAAKEYIDRAEYILIAHTGFYHRGNVK